MILLLLFYFWVFYFILSGATEIHHVIFIYVFGNSVFFSFYVNDFILIISKHRVSLWPKSVSTMHDNINKVLDIILATL